MKTNNQNLDEAAAARLSGLIGLCEKAGKVSAGEFACEKAIKGGTAKLCILAEDASENTKKHFSDMCAYRRVSCTDRLTNKEKLGHMIGKKERSVITIDNEGFAEAILKRIEGGRADE